MGTRWHAWVSPPPSDVVPGVLEASAPPGPVGIPGRLLSAGRSPGDPGSVLGHSMVPEGSGICSAPPPDIQLGIPGGSWLCAGAPSSPQGIWDLLRGQLGIPIGSGICLGTSQGSLRDPGCPQGWLGIPEESGIPSGGNWGSQKDLGSAPGAAGDPMGSARGAPRELRGIPAPRWSTHGPAGPPICPGDPPRDPPWGPAALRMRRRPPPPPRPRPIRLVSGASSPPSPPSQPGRRHVALSLCGSFLIGRRAGPVGPGAF